MNRLNRAIHSLVQFVQRFDYATGQFIVSLAGKCDSRLPWKPLVLAILAIYISRSSYAQVNLPGNQSGTPINTSSIQHGVDSINTMGLGLNIQIPLLSLKERGRTYVWKYVYNTPIYDIIFIPQPTQNNKGAGQWDVFPPGGGYHAQGPDNWRLVDPYSWYLAYDVPVSNSCTVGCGVGDIGQCTLTYNTYTNYRLYDPEGNAHPLGMSSVYYTQFAPQPSGECASTVNTSLTSPTLDGDGSYVDLSAEYGLTGYTGNAFWLKDGTKYSLQPPPTGVPAAPYAGTSIWGGFQPPGVIGIEDANGNLIGKDMMNRVGLTSIRNGNVTTYTYLDANGDEQNIVITFTSVPYQTADCVLAPSNNPCYEGSGNYTLPESILLPNGQSYNFTYNMGGYGELLSMTLPTGATISYTYQKIFSRGSASPRGGTSYVKMGVATRTESVNGNQYLWTYNDSNPMDSLSYSVTVTDPNGNCSTHVYQPLGPYAVPVETTTAWTQACATTPITLKTTATTYSYDLMTPPGSKTNQFNTRPTQTVTTFANGNTLMSQTDYETFNWTDFFGGTQIGTRMNPTETREYDFNATIPTRTTDYYYLHNTGSSAVSAAQYQALNIVDKISSKSIYSGTSSGTALNTIAYDYDNYGTGITKSGALNLDTTYGNWGNVTKQTIIDNTTGRQFISTFTYEDTGNVISSTDPKGNTTSYSYTDSWANSACAASTPSGHIYLTKSTNALQQSTYYSYNSCTGTLASIKDVNSNITQFSYDELGRTLNSNSPDGGITSYSYNDAAMTIQQTSLLTSQLSKTTTTQYDGLGRTIQKTVNDASGNITSTTSYDGVGQVISATNPYRSTSDSTYGVTTYVYDGIGRKVKQTNPDSSVLYWCYDGVTTNSQTNCRAEIGTSNGTWVDSLSANGNDTQHTSDGLGRMTYAVEPTSTSKTPAMITKYVYDANNNLSTVTQNGISGSDSPRSRTFVYNGVSQLMSATNPESGMSSYTYDLDGNVYTKTDARNVTTTYTYDALNRVLSKSYSNDTSHTPFSCYQYDLSVVPNGIGRLANAWTQSASLGACPVVPPSSTGYWTKRTILAYDSMGRILNEQQCTPSNCTNGKPYSSAYSYDLAGNLLTYSNGITTTPTVGTLIFSNTFDAVGRLQAVTSNWSDPKHPSVLFTAQPGLVLPCSNSSTQPYTPLGGLMNGLLGNGVTLNRAYDNMARTTCETDTGTGTTPATSGSTTVTITGLEQSK